MFNHRTFCDTIAEAKAVAKNLSRYNSKRSRDILVSLLEECQTYGNRMEAALYYQQDINSLHKQRKELREEVKRLRLEAGKKEMPRFTEKELLEGVEDADI